MADDTALADSGVYTPQTQQMRTRMAQALLQSGMDSSPIQSPWQGLARVAQALIGGYQFGKIEREEKSRNAAMSGMVQNLLSGSTAAATPTASAGAADIGNYADAISRVESGGNYQALGPVTQTGDRAYGRYQVMGANIPAWTEAAGVGRMTPEQFLANPQAQDAVFKHRFGQYVQQYGPERAAAAWFAGEGGMDNPNARDQLGTSVSDYTQRFNAAAGTGAAAAAGPAGTRPVAGAGTAIGQPSISPETRAAVAAVARANPQAALQMLLPLLIKNDQPTDAQRNYVAYVRDQMARNQPYKSFEDYNLDQRRAGALSVVNAGETRQSQVLGEARGKNEIAIREAGDKAFESIGRINLMRQAMADPNFYSGSGASIVEGLKRFIASFGGNPELVSSIETFKSQANQLVLQALGGSLGAQVSNSDRDFIQATAPRLENTPAGNARMLDVMERIERRKIEVADFQDQYIAQHGKVDDGFMPALRQWRDAHPLFTAEERAQISQGLTAAPGAAPATTGPAAGRVRVWTPDGGIQ